MIGREWTVGHHRFFNASEYQAALRDQKLINTLENTYDLHDIHDLDKLYSEIARGHIRFESVIGREFDDMVYERRIFLHKNTDAQKESGKSRKLHQSGTYSKKSTKSSSISISFSSRLFSCPIVPSLAVLSKTDFCTRQP